MRFSQHTGGRYIFSADHALRAELLPSILIWETILQRTPLCEFMEDNQAVCKICKSGGSQRLMHMPRTHRIDAAAISEQFSRGNCNLIYERTQNEAADIGTKRFTDPVSFVKVMYLVQIVTPKFWSSPDYHSYLASIFDDGLPLKPGGIVKPCIGFKSVLAQGVNKLKGKKSARPKRQGKGHIDIATADANSFLKAQPKGTPKVKPQAKPGAPATGPQAQSRDRLLIEFCTSEDSRRGQEKNIPDHNTYVLRLTEKEDMTSETGLDMAIRAVQNHPNQKITLWSSIPCTGGSPWQYVNEAIYIRRGDYAKLEKLQRHRSLQTLHQP